MFIDDGESVTPTPKNSDCGPSHFPHPIDARTHLLHAVELPDVVEGVDGRGEAPVEAEDLSWGFRGGGDGEREGD